MTTVKGRTLIGLLAALGLAPACGNLDGPPPVEGIAYDQDGSLIVFTASGIHLFDSKLHNEIKAIPFDGLPVTKAVQQCQYSLSADGHTAAVSFPALQAEEPSTIAVFDLTTGAMPFTFHPDDPAPYARAQGVVTLRLSPQADLIYSCSVNADPSISPADWGYRCTMFAVATGLPLWTRDIQQQYWQMPVFSQDGTRLFVQSESPLRIEALDARTGASIYAVDLPGRLHTFTRAADGRLVALVGPPDDKSCPDPWSCPPSTAFWSPTDGTLLDQWAAAPRVQSTDQTVDEVSWCSPWTDLCATYSIDFSVSDQPPLLTAWRTDGTPLHTIPTSGSMAFVAFSPDGKLIATAGFTGSSDPVEVFTVDDGKRVGALNYRWDLL